MLKHFKNIQAYQYGITIGTLPVRILFKQLCAVCEQNNVARIKALSRAGLKGANRNAVEMEVILA
jgi:hypothetical protein